MPRKAKGPRLYLDTSRGQWVIRDGQHFVRTGCLERDLGAAERQLAEYIGRKFKPPQGASPPVTSILDAYASDRSGDGRRKMNVLHTVSNLAKWWGDKTLAQVTARNCRSYAETRTPSAARRDLETLRAAIRHYHREYGPLPAVPAITLPPKSEHRERWLTREEAADLLWRARHTPHLARFILLGLYTGTRSGALLALQWRWIDLESGVMRRRAPRAADSATKRRPPVRLGRRILAHLRRWRRLDDSKIINVVHYYGLPIQSVKRSWARAVRESGLSDDVTPHTLRHTRATWLMQAGIDPWEAAGALGMSLPMLQRYAHHHPQWQRRAAEV